MNEYDIPLEITWRHTNQMQNLGAYYAIKDHIRRELQELYKYLVTRLVNKYYVNLFSFVIKKQSFGTF